jgi:hypothetical protein
VKYQHQQSSDDDTSDFDQHADFNIDQLSLDDKLNDENYAIDNHTIDDPLNKEIQHLRKRIQNITFSIQSSPLGLSNLNTWRSNCLNPIKNVLNEWRSVLSFHSKEIMGGESDEKPRDGVELQQHQMLLSDGNNTKQAVLQDLLHEISTKVFSLLQMSMQTGPLVGSNPGYFKRCGGEVALIALEFLNYVIDLAGVVTAADEEVENANGIDVDAENSDAYDQKLASSDVDVNSNGDDSSSSRSVNVGGSETESTNSDTPRRQLDSQPANMATTTATTTSLVTNELQIVQTLQSSFLFTEKESMRLYQWRRNAQKAVGTNKVPSKSALKLQSQKSKKQRQKELRMERKLKKNKGGGRG